MLFEGEETWAVQPGPLTPHLVGSPKQFAQLFGRFFNCSVLLPSIHQFRDRFHPRVAISRSTFVNPRRTPDTSARKTLYDSLALVETTSHALHLVEHTAVTLL